MAQNITSFLSLPPAFAPFLASVLEVWDVVWWLVLLAITSIFFWEAWLLYLGWRWARGLNFKLLEIKVPKNILKTPKAMEQIFAAAHAPYSYGIRPFDYYWKGQRESWMSFELIGKAGESRFYLRVPAKLRNMMESAIYSQYPEAEINEAEDYLHAMPHIIPNKDFTCEGFEEELRHEDYLPLRTYPLFEDPTEERRVDTIGGLLEVMSKLRGDEQIWLQIIIVPTGEDFRKEGEEAINEILHIEDEEKKSPSIFPSLDLGVSLGDALTAPFKHPEPAQERKEEREQKLRFLVATHEKERAEAIQRKIAKLAFHATVRFLVIDRKEQPARQEFIMPLHGYMRQFNTQDLNSLKPTKATTTASYAVRGLFKKRRIHWRQRSLYEHYYFIVPAHHASILNIEELATIFHFPTTTVATSELEKVESRKGTPPAALPLAE